MSHNSKHALLATLLILVGCGESSTTKRFTQAGGFSDKDQESSNLSEGERLGLTSKAVWHKGWDDLIKNGGNEFAQLPGNGQTPKTILAVKSKKTGNVKLLDYWLRATGWTTMFGITLKACDNKNQRTDGVRWDTPTYWVPKRANGASSGGNMTLMTQFGSEIPSYWKGAEPYMAQTEWVFNINWENGGIMEIFDRQHFGFNADGTIKKAFSEVVAKSYYESLYWAPHYNYPVASGNYFFEGPANFVGNDNKIHSGYSKVEVINRYDSFTVPPSRNLSKDCPAAEFKDVIAVKHYQYWWDPKTSKSRADYMVIYMAKNIGWIYVLLNDGIEFNAQGQIIKNSKHFQHMSPQGYVSQSGGWKRICAHEFRDMYVNK